MAYLRLLAVVMLACIHVAAQTPPGDFRLSLPRHRGQLRWIAEGFKIAQWSAKPGGTEIGVRALDGTGVMFLGFLFLFPEQAPMTSAKCRDGVMEPEKKTNPRLRVVNSIDGKPAVVTYTSPGRNGQTHYMVRAFVATADVCGDLEFSSERPLSIEDSRVKAILASYRLYEEYVPQYKDAWFYAQVLYDSKAYGAAAPIYETALEKLNDGVGAKAGPLDIKTARRLLTDQAGMSYGMSGNIAKARALFEKGIAADPEYPLYYYNLACADAEEQNLAGARKHLEAAFARRANVNAGETMPDPTEDDSFKPYRGDKGFWDFLLTLRKR